MTTHPEIQAEQTYIDRAYDRLEVMRERARRIASDVITRGKGGTHQARLERDVLVTTSARRLSQLSIGTESLVFGRIDTSASEKYYIGRLAVSDEEQEPLVIDWRAPVAEPFYRATGVSPMGLIRRRHLLCRGKRVVGIEDELLDDPPEGADLVLVGEAALMAALERARTGRMRDIVETIQAEQDEIIRAPLKGATVVQGGPGTGKTAVALHRAAYLLYTHRDRLEKQGVLLVGPNSIFIRYIEQVLPSLGEESARLVTPANIFPRVKGILNESPRAARIKGDLRMKDVLARSLSEIERPLKKDLNVWYENFALKISIGASKRVLDRVKKMEGAHNQKRSRLEQLLVRELFRDYRKQQERASARRSLVDPNQERGDFDDQISTDGNLLKAAEEMWPLLTAEDLVGRLLTSKTLLRNASKGVLSPNELAPLTRDSNEEWSVADVALLDEALALLGPPPRPQVVQSTEDPTEAWFIDQVLDDMAVDPLMRSQIRDRIKEMYRGDGAEEEPETLFRDYGHVLVDEAQDLSPMQWRMIARRCPSGSMTIVGDLGQASEVWAPESWGEILSQLPLRDGAKLKELTINYRTPQEIMDFALPLLEAATPGLVPPKSVRSTGTRPMVHPTDSASLIDVAQKIAEAEREALVEGRVGVVAPFKTAKSLRQKLGLSAAATDLLDEEITVLTLDEAKGLEFDSVVVVEPAEIASEHAHGLRALYVAFTRATTRLAIVHSEPLPQELG